MLIVQRLRHTNGLQKRLLARASIMEKRGGGGAVECVHVCVRVRVKERERKARTGTFFSLRFMPVVKQCHSSHKQAEKSSTALPVMFMCPLLENLLALLSGCSLEHQRSRHEDNRLAAFWIVQRWSEENPSPGSNFSQIGYYLLFRRLMR